MPPSRAASIPGFQKKYRTKSKLSVIDEMLFARTPKLDRKDSFSYVKNKNAPLMSQVNVIYQKPRKPQAIRLYTKDLVRDLVVPLEDPSGLTVIIAPSKFSRILKSAEVQTSEMIIKVQEQAELKKKKLALEAEQKLNEYNEKDFMRVKNSKLNELDIEAKEKAQVLLENAMTKRIEQEDDMKRLNELCLNARCHAIRDAQMIEKKIIGDEIAAEEKRLDDMMEIDRIKAIKQQEDMEEMKKKERYAGAAQIMQQIEAKAENKLLELEIKDVEGQKMLQYLEKLQKEDLETLDVKRIRQKKLWEEVTQILDGYEKKKRYEKEQDLAADKRVMKFLQEKEEREVAKEQEQTKRRKEREIEIARLRNKQQRVLDLHEEQIALRLKRNQEQQEREWRKREEREANKKAETNAILKKARSEQINAKQHHMAVEAQRDRREFETVLKKLKRQIHEERVKEERERNERYKHGEEIRQQIVEKETVKLGERKAMFQEGVMFEEKERKRKEKLEKAKEKKLEHLRKTGVPERYCKEVERRLQVPERLTSYLG